MTASTITLIPDDTTLPRTRRERDQHEARKCRQLEFENGDEELDGKNEKRQDHDDPGKKQNHDRHEIVEEGREADQRTGLLQQRIGCLKSCSRELAGPQQIGSRQSTVRRVDTQRRE
jgi:hypothetical protein